MARNPKKFKSSDVNIFVNKTFKNLYEETVNRFINLKTDGYIVKYIWESDWKKFKCGDSELKIKTFKGNKL